MVKFFHAYGLAEPSNARIPIHVSKAGRTYIVLCGYRYDGSDKTEGLSNALRCRTN